LLLLCDVLWVNLSCLSLAGVSTLVVASRRFGVSKTKGAPSSRRSRSKECGQALLFLVLFALLGVTFGVIIANADA
jgi:hypothetical protein